jgi:aminopeptidase-like protein
VDFKDNPLHIVSYSLPIDKVLTWDELQPHLYFNEKRPNAVPWIFKYYERDWGFCLPKNTFDKLPRDRKYHAVIRSEFITDPKQGFKVATAVVHPQGGPNPNAGEMIIQAHTCHPMQANDDGAGVVSAIELARRLAEKPLPAGSMSVRFWFGPETIGTIAYLAHNESLIPNLRGGIFLEMTGNRNKIAWHHTRQHDHLLDRITNYVLRSSNTTSATSPPRPPTMSASSTGLESMCPASRSIAGPTRNITPPTTTSTSCTKICCSARRTLPNRSSAFTPAITSRSAPSAVPVFLSGHGLWVDWRDNWDLNRAIEKIMMRFEGRHSVFDIAEQVGLDYWMVREYVERFRAKGFIVPLPIPSVAETS